MGSKRGIVSRRLRGPRMRYDVALRMGRHDPPQLQSGIATVGIGRNLGVAMTDPLARLM